MGFIPLSDPAEVFPKVLGYVREAGRDVSKFGLAGRLLAGPGGSGAWIEAARKLQGLGATQLGISAPPDLQGAAALERMLEARRVLGEEFGS